MSTREFVRLPDYKNCAAKQPPKPIPSMYGIFTYIWLIFIVNVGKYIIHGSYGKVIWLEQAKIRRPESAWHGNILCRIQTMSVEASSKPKSKIQTPKSKLQTAPFGAATKRTKTKLIQNPKSKLQNPRSKIQNPNSKLQNPNGPFGVWILDFGFGRAGTGGDGYVANDDVWPRGPHEFGLVGGALACSRKVAGSIPPTARFPPRAAQIGHRFPAEGLCRKSSPDFRPRVVEIGAQFPEKLRARLALLKTLGRHRAAPNVCVSARVVNITRHRPCVHMQETSASHSIMDFCCVGNIYEQASFSTKHIFGQNHLKYHRL